MFFKGTQEGCAVCLDTKEAKNQVSPKGFFAAQAFALQNG